jgi:nucleoid-associated protein YgaU
MALSEKTAVVICTVFTVGMPCALHRFAAPVEVPSPLTTVGVRADAVNLVQNAGFMPDVRVDPRPGLVRQFQRPNAVDMQARDNRTAKDALALRPPETPLPGDGGPLELPPLMYKEVAMAEGDSGAPGLPASADGRAAYASTDRGGSDSTAPAATGDVKLYRVAKGDTLSKIARREWSSDDRRLVELLMELNPTVRERKSRIVVGEELVIPDTAAVERVLAGASPSAALVFADAAPSKAEVEAAIGSPKTADPRWYTIQRKDTLASIAKRFLHDSQRWREIVALNRALDPNKIVPGTRIKLPPVLRLAQG